MSVIAFEQRKVLVLNKNFSFIGFRSLRKAITMIFSQKAVIVHPQDYQLFNWDDWSKLKPVDENIINTPGGTFRVPTIIKLINYDKLPQHQIRFSRRALFKRDKGKCAYCGCKLSADSWSIDHILPKSRGGISNWNNSCLCCLPCNIKKRNRTPEEAGMKLLIKPHKPKTLLPHVSKHYIKDWQGFISELYWSVPLEMDE